MNNYSSINQLGSENKYLNFNRNKEENKAILGRDYPVIRTEDGESGASRFYFQCCY